MKLYITRDQESRKGLLGGHKGMRFILSCRIELSPEETDLVEKYKQWNVRVYSYLTIKEKEVIHTLRDLCNGITVWCDGAPDLLADEERIKEACENLKILLDVMASFGGEEVIEY